MKKITPTKEQAAAIAAIKEWYHQPWQQEFLLDGEAGTGKSTTAGIAVAELTSKARTRCRRVVSGAYTAKAALVMRRKGIEDATTVHKMIYRLDDEDDNGQPRFVIDHGSLAASADLIVIDEVSMVDQRMANDLRGFGKKILVLGDTRGQLPPVEGAGAFTSRQPDFQLTEPNRFALESPIIRLAAMARRGERLPIGAFGEGVNVVRLTKETANLIYRPDTQVLCGIHRTRWAISQLMRGKLGFDGPSPADGEKIICCRNNHKLGLCNGAFGVVHGEPEVDEKSGYIGMSVVMDDGIGPLDAMWVSSHNFRAHFSGPIEKPRYAPGVEEFDWGYCITVHKSQGSEWPHITLVDDSRAFRDHDLRRRWVYTGITRAIDGLTVLVRD